MNKKKAKKLIFHYVLIKLDDLSIYTGAKWLWNNEEKSTGMVFFKMKRKHKTYSKPKRPFDKARIDEEAEIKKEFGLKNKKEIWKADAKINSTLIVCYQLYVSHDTGPIYTTEII